ncbi:MAG: two-component regulator propeller domain-containing protein [Acidobacteriota bacterium]
MRRLALTGVACLALMASTAPFAAASPPSVRFEQLSVDDGLPDGQINSIYQDSRGFLWISTRNGLGRYDGRTVVVHRYDPNDERTINGNWVGPVLEDPRGRLVISLGVGGLDRFDPNTGLFEHIDLTPETPEPSDFSTTDLAIDADGTLWVGTLATGLFRLDAGDSITRFRAADGLGLDADMIADLEIDAVGRLWLATCGGGLSVRIDGRFHKVRGDDGLSSDCLRRVVTDKLGAWVGSTAGVDRVLLQDWPDDDPELRVESFASGQPAGSVGAIAFDQRGSVWVGIDGRGLAQLRPDVGEWRLFPFAAATGLAVNGRPRGSLINGVSFLDIDDEDRVWVSTFGSGLYLYDPESDSMEQWIHDAADPTSLASDAVSAALFDRSQGLWVGTAGRGLSFYSPWRFKFGGLRWDPLGREGLKHPTVLDIVVDGDRLWIGTAAGLESFHVPSGRLESMPLAGVTSPLRALEIDAAGHLWLGTSLSGLFRYSPSTGELRAFPSVAGDPTTPSTQSYRHLKMARDPQYLWLGTNQGFIDRLDVTTGDVQRRVATVQSTDGRQSAVWALEEDARGNLWVGAPSLGLFRFDLATGESKRYERDPNNPNAINNRTVNSLFLDSRDRLWVGTFSGGLDRYDPERDAFVHLTERDGLPSNMVEAILEQPAGVLWLATRHGLARYDPQSGDLATYRRRDGLVADGFATGAGARSANGRLFFGGLGGVVNFRPDEISSNPHLPPVALTRFRRLDADGRHDVSLDGVEEVVVRPGDQVFGFSFAALDFADPGRNRFAYRLEGFDPDWIAAGTDPSASYTNIDPGRYIFRVQGSNADGLWNRDGASIRVWVKPPFWQTRWFRALEALALALALVGAYLWQRRALLTRERRERERLEHQRKSRELRMAQQMQRTLLPREDFTHPRVEIAGRHRTASEVGGDYFDVIEQSDGHSLYIAIGDAVGHGMAAGFVVGMVKAGLLNALRSETLEPDDLLTGLDAMLRDAAPQEAARSPERLPVSMGLAVARIDLDSRAALTLHLASVAMPYPYIWRFGARRLETVEVGGLPLGQRLGRRPRAVSFHLAQDDLLIFVSDGLVERLNHDAEPWGFDAVEEALTELSSRGILTPAALCHALLSACDRWADGLEADDDMTVLVVQAKDLRRATTPPR